MPNITNAIAGNASGDLLKEAIPTSDVPPASCCVEDIAGTGTAHSTGILPSHELEHLVRVTKDIFALEPVENNQIQPASIDLRLGPVAYRVRASFLPGKETTVAQRLED